MKVADFHVLSSCPKDELQIEPTMAVTSVVHYTSSLQRAHYPSNCAQLHIRPAPDLQRPNLICFDKNKVKHQIISNEAVARVFRRLADRLQGVVADTRSTRDCGRSGARSLALAACLCPKLNGSARRPSLRLQREAGRRSGQDRVRLVQNDGYILGIYQVYTAIYTF